MMASFLLTPGLKTGVENGNFLVWNRVRIWRTRRLPRHNFPGIPPPPGQQRSHTRLSRLDRVSPTGVQRVYMGNSSSNVGIVGLPRGWGIYTRDPITRDKSPPYKWQGMIQVYALRSYFSSLLFWAMDLLTEAIIPLLSWCPCHGPASSTISEHGQKDGAGKKIAKLVWQARH